MFVHDQLSEVSEKLLAWYDAHARILPWRTPPGSSKRPDPYGVWLSEVMLQQTTVAAVKSYYAKFMAIWPTVQNLAAADDGDVMAAWAGLGYYARARNLLACARAVVRDHGGLFPNDYAQLRTLPGLGDYTAASVAAIAFGKAVPVIDANVERVMTRLCAIDRPLPVAKPEIRERLAPIVPVPRPGDFAQAMMDLGATLCTARKAVCVFCPLQDVCMAHQMGNPEQFPVKPVKPQKPERHGIAYWMERDGTVLLVRRPDTGLLGGMLALPGPDWAKLPAGTPPPSNPGSMARVVHIFTHFRLTLDIAAMPPQEPQSKLYSGNFVDVSELLSVGLPTLYAKAVTAVLAQKG